MKFKTMFQRIERKMLHVIRAFGRHAFWCDGHPWLCVNCKNLRLLVKEHRTHNFHMIFYGSKPKWIWRSGEALKLPLVVVHG